MFIGVNSPYLVLEIRRDHIIRDALFQVSSEALSPATLIFTSWNPKGPRI